MNPDMLSLMLSRPEQDTVEFKRELNLYNENGKINSSSRDEFVKDILALANGNTHIVGDTKYLVVGADDKLNDNKRQIYDVTGRKLPSASDIQKIVNAVCYPAITGIQATFVEIDGKNLYVISIPPLPSLYETIRDLRTPKKYNEHLVFVRRDEDIGIASAKEREAIAQLKYLHFSRSKNVPPVQFGAIIGAILSYVFWSTGVKATIDTSVKSIHLASSVVITVLGSLMGAMWGWNYKEYKEVSYSLANQPTKIRVTSTGLIIALAMATLGILNRILNRSKK